MTRISKHFTLAEATRSATAIAKGIENTPDTTEQLCAIYASALGMEQVRAILGHKPISPTSWYRNKQVNSLVGGTPTSDHMSGWCVDFAPPSIHTLLKSARLIAESQLMFDQLIMETSRGILHISFDPKQRRMIGEQRQGAGTPIVWALPRS